MGEDAPEDRPGERPYGGGRDGRPAAECGRRNGFAQRIRGEHQDFEANGLDRKTAGPVALPGLRLAQRGMCEPERERRRDGWSIREPGRGGSVNSQRLWGSTKGCACGKGTAENHPHCVPFFRAGGTQQKRRRAPDGHGPNRIHIECGRPRRRLHRVWPGWNRERRPELRSDAARRGDGAASVARGGRSSLPQQSRVHARWRALRPTGRLRPGPRRRSIFPETL